MGLLEKLKDATNRKAKVMELLQGFVDVRIKDIELLWLFLDLIEQTRQIHSAKEAETIIEHFHEIQKKTEEESEASSEIFTKKQVNV